MAVTERTPILRKDGSEKYIAAAAMVVCAYNIMVVDTLLLCLRQRIDLQHWEQSLLATAALVGALVGATVFGVCGDTQGRYKGFLWSGFMMLLGSTASAFSYASTTHLLVMQLSGYRFIVGLGVGGLYPLIATIVTENVSAEHSPIAVAVTFSMHGVGFLLSCLFPLVLFAAHIHTEVIWRVSALAGVLPMVFILYQWWQIKPMTVNATMHAFPRKEGYSMTGIMVKHSVALTGTCFSWFVSSLVYYGLACFRSQIAKGFTQDVGPMNEDQIFRANALSMLFAAAAIPGFITMIACIDRVGVRTLQICGFGFMGLICIIAVQCEGESALLVTAILSLAFFFSCAGPNSTTYILPAVHFPVSERSTCHGISGTCGKMGAIVGGAAFPLWNQAFGLTGVLYACTVACFVGMVCTLTLCPSPDVRLKNTSKNDPLKYFDLPQNGKDRLIIAHANL